MHDSALRVDHRATDFRHKIVSAEALAAILRNVRHRDDFGRAPVVVQCHGCFDIVHPGHVRYLQFARSQGDVLVVSITADADISKGAQKPYVPQELRAESLAALSIVDYVTIDPHPTAVEILTALRPDVYVKGREYAASDDPRFIAERSVVESNGGRVVFSSGDVVFSSSKLVESIQQDTALEQERLALVCQRHNVGADSLIALLARAKGLRVLVVGDLVVDRYVQCDACGMSNESPMMSLRRLDERDYLGGAAGVAMHLASAGARPVLVTASGRGPLSRWADAALASGGVELRRIEHRDDLPLVTRFLVDDQKVMKVASGRPSPLDSCRERAAIKTIEAAVNDADACILHDAGQGMLSPGVLKALTKDLRSRISFLAGGAGEAQTDAFHFRDADLICCSERRLRSAMSDAEGSLSTLAYRAIEKSETKQLIVTVGKRGLVTFDRPSHDRSAAAWRGRLLSEYLPSFATRVVDRLGGSDAVLAFSTLVRALGGSLMQAAYLASLAAALSIEHMGPTAVSAGELRARITCRPELQRTRCDHSDGRTLSASNLVYEDELQPV